MTADTDPRCPLCGAMLQPMVEHYCKIDPDSIDAPIVVAVCERLPAAGWLPPADAARLRALLRELVEVGESAGALCSIVVASRPVHSKSARIASETLPRLRAALARARAEVGDSAGDL